MSDLLKGAIKVVQAVASGADKAASDPVLPTWAWALIGVAGLALMLGLACCVARRRKV